jgi:glutaredoxin 3
MADQLELYVKIWCPWCVRAQQWLDAQGYSYQLHDVESDPTAYQRMITLSSQRYTPTLTINGKHVLADFGPEELAPFLHRHQFTR